MQTTECAKCFQKYRAGNKGKTFCGTIMWFKAGLRLSGLRLSTLPLRRWWSHFGHYIKSSLQRLMFIFFYFFHLLAAKAKWRIKMKLVC